MILSEINRLLISFKIIFLLLKGISSNSNIIEIKKTVFYAYKVWGKFNSCNLMLKIYTAKSLIIKNSLIRSYFNNR